MITDSVPSPNESVRVCVIGKQNGRIAIKVIAPITIEQVINDR